MRYLFGFQRRFNTPSMGVQKRFSYLEPDKLDPESIQGALEIALQQLKCTNKPVVHISSRTDTGVHAIQSAVHVDLQTKSGHPFDENNITTLLNRYLNRTKLELRILNTQRVSNKFNARYDAILRTYLYRLAVLRSETSISSSLSFIPIEEFRRCYFVTNPVFNIEAVREAATLLIGRHDFRSFMSTGSKIDTKSSVRTIERLEFNPGSPLVTQEYSNYPFKSIRKPVEYDYWNVTFASRSFLYRQIRRTIGVLLAVGQGKLTYSDVKCLLQVPSRNSWDARACTAPAHGLYLLKVEYRPEDLAFTETS